MEEMFKLLDPGIFGPIDVHFARLMCILSGCASHELALAAALVSRVSRQGHTCLNLHDPLAGIEDVTDAAVPELPHPRKWVEILRDMPVVGGPGSQRPLILDDALRLYLRRAHEDESVLADRLVQLSKSERSFDEDRAAYAVRKVFGEEEADGFSPQKAAAAIALACSLCVITGGPGTGKTTLVCRILAVLLMAEPMLKIALAAPTGKAARRMAETVGDVLERLDLPVDVKARIPKKASTLHRLLGAAQAGRGMIANDDTRLDVDVLVIDEASMADLAVMARLARSLKDDARLILVGDKNQLASVEAGYVLGDICGRDAHPGYSDRLARIVEMVARCKVPRGRGGPMADSIVELTRIYRFDEASPIHRAGSAVKDGDADAALALLYGSDNEVVAGGSLPTMDLAAGGLADMVVQGYGPYLRASDPLEKLRLLDAFRIVCALRGGPYGVESLNSEVVRILAEKGLVSPRGRFYENRPVLVTENDYTVGLFNGDVGVVVRTPGGLRVCFEAEDGGMRMISPVRLPPHESAYAMTVHKSQGSEFDHVLVILPDHDSPLFTRELVYTALTRARKRVTLWADPAVFRTAVSRRTARLSGLGDRLHGRGS